MIQQLVRYRIVGISYTDDTNSGNSDDLIFRGMAIFSHMIPIPIGSVCMDIMDIDGYIWIYMVTFTINIPPLC